MAVCNYQSGDVVIIWNYCRKLEWTRKRWVTQRAFLTSGSLTDGGKISFTRKNVGPVSQLDKSLLAIKPLDEWSAGFSAVEIYLHFLWVVWRWIFRTLLATNVWNRRARWLMYPRTTMELVQKNSSAATHSSSSLSVPLTVTETTAGFSCNLGMVMTLMGETWFSHDKKSTVNMSILISEPHIWTLAISTCAGIRKIVFYSLLW